VLKKIIGSNYASNSLLYCRKNNIQKILVKYGADMGVNNNFKGHLTIDNYTISNANNIFSNINIGSNCYIGKDVFFDIADKIILEDDVVISARVVILTHGDVGNRAMNKYYKRVSQRVFIGFGSWIGANVTILVGVTIGKYCVVAAGSVVLHDIPDYTIVAGVPAVIKKELL
jgi:maltose O-acetyltransferase